MDGRTIAIARHDFNRMSFRGNAVLRWEWRPGSTLFLVWQQNRDASDQRSDLVRIPDLFRALTASGSQVFAVKVSYWVAP